MNPSANGWIKKLLKLLEENPLWNHDTTNNFYKALRDSGFVYGSNTSVVNNYLESTDYTEEEICKVNFLLAFHFIYKEHCTTDDNFVESIINFYTEINAHKPSVFSELLGEKKNTALLEKIIHKRIQIDHNLIDRSFNYFITNALLFTDILAYNVFLKKHTISERFIQHLEAVIETIVIEVLNSKSKKTKYDESLIDLVEQSKRYQTNVSISFDEALTSINTNLETYYILDIACMATWGDLKIDDNEETILKQLGEKLKVKNTRVENSMAAIQHFYSLHKDKIALLSSKNIVKTFYSNSSQMVSKLISRNSKRLQKELRESKELMILLTQSTVRDLNDDEQKKVQDQLLDIFKSIPSLAIFMLPGGALLLPLVVKFIPKLLPSSFDDNRIEED